MGRPRKIKNDFLLKIRRRLFRQSVDWLAEKYKVSKRTIWRHLK